MLTRPSTAAALAALALLLAPVCRAESFGRSLDELVAVARRSPADPRAELAALEAFAQWDESPKAVRAALASIAGVRGLGEGARERVRELVAVADLREGKVAAARADFEARGFVSSWRVLGPLAPDARDAPIAGLLDEGREHDGLRGPVRWRPAPREAVSSGRLELAALFSGLEEICALAAADVDAGRAGPAVLRLSAAGSIEAEWNGARVFYDARLRRVASTDRAAIRVAARRGPNRLVVRVCSGEGVAMAVSARLVDGARPGVPAALDALLARASARGASAPDRADAALYAHLTGADAAGAHEERDLARGACRESRGARPCLVWGALAVDPNERREALEAAASRDPGSAVAAAGLAFVELESGDPARASRRAEEGGPTAAALAIDLARIEILAARGLPLAALALAREAAGRWGDAPALLIAAARIAKEAGAASRHLGLCRALAASRFDLAGPHVELAAAAGARGDAAALDAEVRGALDVAPADRATLLALADALGRAGRPEGAAEALGRALALDPVDAGALTRLGLLDLRAGRRDAGLARLRRAAALDPGDAWLAGYLDELAPAEPFEAPYVVPPESFLSWRGGAEGEAAILVESQVVRVAGSGLVSRFVQIAVEVRSARAAREFRTHAVEHAPATQRVKIIAARVFRAGGAVENATGRASAPISEPWYRLYYDLEAELVELPPLEPGDVVEYRYRIDDLDVPGAMRGTFGDLVYAEDALPKRLWRYVLIAPRAMALEIAGPGLPGAAASEEAAGETLVRRFEAERIGAAHLEDGAPGEGAGRAYLHVSAFPSARELGAWYAGLAREQARPDDRIREKARELARGRATAAAKVAAIYAWVVSATRYVGLEFGVHGHKPYRAAQVMARGFGDCKDKATLLVALLGAAGVRAELALVRTRAKGPIAEAPASLEMFDHALAYVPELDLWLDGTAGYHGSRELPFQDQGVLALRLAEAGPVLARTPVAPAGDSSLEEELRVSLDRDGGARAEAVLAVRGAAFAPAYRHEFEAESLRAERFGAVAAERFPGARIESVSFEGLADPEGEVRVRYAASVPSLGALEGDRMIVAVDRGERLAGRYASTASRRLPLEVGQRRIVERRATISPPPGFRAVGVPGSARIETPFGSLALDARIGPGGEARVSRRFELSVHEVPPGDYPRFAAFCRDVDRALAAPVIFERAP